MEEAFRLHCLALTPNVQKKGNFLFVFSTFDLLIIIPSKA